MMRELDYEKWFRDWDIAPEDPSDDTIQSNLLTSKLMTRSLKAGPVSFYNDKIRKADIVFSLNKSYISESIFGDSPKENLKMMKANVRETAKELFSNGKDIRIAVMGFSSPDLDSRPAVLGQHTYISNGSEWARNIDEVDELLSQISIDTDFSWGCVEAGLQDIACPVANTGHPYTMRKDADKYVFLYSPETDVRSYYGTSEETYSSLCSLIAIYNTMEDKDIKASFMFEEYDCGGYTADWAQIITGGTQGSYYDSSAYTDAFYFVYDTAHKSNPTSFISSYNFKTITLADALAVGGDTDTDEDGLSDWAEVDNDNRSITFELGTIHFPTYNTFLKTNVLSSAAFNSLMEYFYGKTRASFVSQLLKREILPLTSDPTKVDSDEDNVIDNIDALPLQFNKTVSYIFVPYNDDEIFDFIARGYRHKLNEQTNDIVQIVYCKNTQDFIDFWDDMDMSYDNKILYKINQVHILGHGNPHTIAISPHGNICSNYSDENFHLSNDDITPSGLPPKEIELINIIGCNCGNLDFNTDDNGEGKYGDNIAISFLKSYYGIKKVTAWDGYVITKFFPQNAYRSDKYCADQIDKLVAWSFPKKPLTYFNSDFQKWSHDVNGWNREPEQMITYYRNESERIIISPCVKTVKFEIDIS